MHAGKLCGKLYVWRLVLLRQGKKGLTMSQDEFGRPPMPDMGQNVTPHVSTGASTASGAGTTGTGAGVGTGTGAVGTGAAGAAGAAGAGSGTFGAVDTVSGTHTQTTQQIPYTPSAAQGATTGATTPSGVKSVGSSNNPTQDTKEQKPKKAKTVLVSAVAGAVAACAVVLALRFTGVIGSTQIIKTTNSAAGQTINITADNESATVAQAAAAKALPSVVSVNVTTPSGTGLGTGVIYDTNGNIITNYHVIDGATAISVTYGGKSFDAKVVGSDASSDIAVIHVDWGNTQVTPIEQGDSDELVVGDWVMSVGSPFGLDQSVSAGIVSSLARNTMMQSASGYTLYTNLIQTDASINPGNSGGALVNDEGELVGICTLFSSDTDSFAGIGFAIPGNYATKIADTIISGQKVTHAYIGLSMQTVNAQNATANNLPVNQGAYVAEVTSGSPADQAGIKKGDIIVAVDGEEITSADGMILAVRSHNIGDTVAVTVNRDGSEQTVNVTLGNDEQLQEQQQQQQQNNGLGGNGSGSGSGTGNGTSYQDIMNQIYEYLNNQNGQNSRGGSYSSQS